MAGDLRWLICAARVARGEGTALLPSQFMGDGASANGALRSALAALRKHIGAGRALATDARTIDAVDAVLEQRRARRAKAPAVAVAVRVGDLVGSAQ